MFRLLIFLSLLLGPPFLLAVEELPDMGDSAGALISPEQEHRVGEAFLRDLRSQQKVIDDPESEAYINALGHRLSSMAQGQTNPFTFFVVDSPVINAFAIPGGFIGVHAGLILQTRTESELAAVMAHEISHVTQRHAARMFEAASKLSIPTAVAMLGAIALGVVAPQAGQAALMAVTAGEQQYALNFTRANEQEADTIGMQLLARAGFNPQAMADFFERLQTANRYNDPANVPEFLRDHPVTTNRIADARARAEQYPKRHYEESVAFYLARARLQVLTARNPQDIVRMYADNLRNGQYQVEEAAHYGYALALVAAGEHDKARQELERLSKAAPDEAAYMLALASLDVDDEQYPRALQTYRKVLQLYPDYHPAVLGYARALLSAGRGKEALQTLRDYTRTHDLDPRGYRLLAEAEGQAGDPIESHLSQADYYYISGELPQAIQQVKIVQDKQNNASYYQRERAQAYQEQWQKEFDEQEKERKRGQP
ncbi:MAG TPA: M48 family metalloprotease [Gammaproteobacteria bacterium]|nr:M48 family metalloprotease [Gammaproteobacteria bacterium]